MTNDQPEGASWRRRHPVLSRAILYGLGLALVVIAVVLLAKRKDVDEQDRLQYLDARLLSLDLLFGSKEGRQQARQVLHEEYQDAKLPPDLRARAIRVQAQLDAKDGDHEGALARLDEAAALEVSPASAFAMAIERAETLQIMERGEDALAVLERAGAAPNGVLALVRASVRAWILGENGRGADALESLERVLAQRQRAWEGETSQVVGALEVQPSHAWIQATRMLGTIRPLRAEDWIRVAQLFPADTIAASTAAQGLMALGADEQAARVWLQLKMREPQAAAREEAADPSLAGLQKIFEEGLKAEDGKGR